MNEHPSCADMSGVESQSLATGAAEEAKSAAAAPNTTSAVVATKAIVKKSPAGKATLRSKQAPAKKAVSAKKAAKPPAVAKVSAALPKEEVAGKPSKKPGKVRPHLVRDSFTMPEADFGLIAALKSKALDARRAAKKSELLRAGLRLLSSLEAKALVAALDKLEPVKIGRPKKGH